LALLSLDGLGFKAPGVIHWWALDDDNTLYCIKELKFQGKTDAEVAAMVQAVEITLDLWDEKRDESRITGVADTQLWEQRGDSGKNKAEVFRERGVPWRPADKKSKATNAGHLIKRLVDHDMGTKTPGIVFFNTCKYIIAVLPAIQTSVHSSESRRTVGKTIRWTRRFMPRPSLLRAKVLFRQSVSPKTSGRRRRES